MCVRAPAMLHYSSNQVDGVGNPSVSSAQCEVCSGRGQQLHLATPFPSSRSPVLHGQYSTLVARIPIPSLQPAIGLGYIAAAAQEMIMFSSCATLIKWALWLSLWFLRCLAVPLLRIRALWPAKKLPPIKSKLLLQSASSLAHMIRTKQVTSEEVVEAFVARIQAVNPLLNAVVDERFQEALKEARAVDKMLRVNTKSADQLAKEMPLLGVPFTVKESIAVEGKSHACGQKNKEGDRAAEDAESVRLLRAVGAIPLLVSNCPELCMSYETFNKVTGCTNNPYDIRRTPGGSSGGEAALLGAAASVISLVSDIGGSARLPAMFTGVFGHKPTPGVVPSSGHIPTATDKNWYRYFSVCLMARYAKDLPTMLKILAHENAYKLRLDEMVDISTLKVFYMENDGGGITTDKVHPEIRAAMRRVIDHFQSTYNIKPQEANLKDLKYSFDLAVTTLFRLEGITSVFQKGSDPTEWNSVLWEFIKFITFTSSSSLPAILYGVVKKAADKLSDQDMKEVAIKINELQKQFKELLGENGVFLYPTYTYPANFHYEMYFRLFNCTYSSIFNTLEMPATHCTMGLSRDGLPIGLQVVAAPCQDRLSLAMACELEAAFGGWVPPPALDHPA